MSTAPPPSSLHRWFGRLLARRRLAVQAHGAAHVPASGPALLTSTEVSPGDAELLRLFAPRDVHVVSEPHSVRALVRLLADDQALGLLLEGAPGVVERDRFHRRAAYLALVSGAPVVPVTFVRERGLDIVYGAAYRTHRSAWPRTRKVVDATSLDLSVHVLVARDTALRAIQALTGGTR